MIRFSVAQVPSTPTPKKPGELYFSWGYNRDWYSKSDIHVFRYDADPSRSYDFMLYDATAHDKPDMENFWYIDRLTIPQYDMKVGYFFNDKHNLGVELAWDHLKYVVTDWQMVHIKGQVNGVPIDAVQSLDPNFLHLQHTNGNNYLLASVMKKQDIFISKNIQIQGIGKLGAGALISYTIDTILGDYDPGYFHYHGWVAATSLGIRASLLKHLFVQTDMQGAFANYTNTKLGHEHLGTAQHHFYSLQWTWELGVKIQVGKN